MAVAEVGASVGLGVSGGYLITWEDGQTMQNSPLFSID